VPNSAASDWHCKYKISASTLVPVAYALDADSLADKSARDLNNGWIYLEAL